MAFRQTHILAQNLIFPHTLFQEQKQCEKTSDKIILSIFFFFKNQNWIFPLVAKAVLLGYLILFLHHLSPASQAVPKRMDTLIQLVSWKMTAVWAPCSAYQIPSLCVSALAGAHPNTSQGSFGKGHLVPAPVPTGLHWEKTFQQTWYWNTGQERVEQMLQQWFR